MSMAAGDAFEITLMTDVKVSELAAVLGLSANRIHQLAKDGIIQPVKRGRYPLAASVQAYIDFVRKGTGDEDDIKQAKLLNSANVTLKQAKAIIAQMEAKELAGKMHRSEDVAAMTEDLVYSIRNMLNALPGRLATDVAGTDNPAEAADIIRREINRMLRELANYHYDPEAYAARVNERRQWEGSSVGGAADVGD